ncbi:peptidoglycan-binding domain-containing protein [Streptomyces resistomycificus]|uniref:peptidoglycan-binding domain-containing protein n=1 Tax=Streptomyces resistomycificus TaxID=67356 RepID=UPI00068DCB90|nr:peptidoglycan-binding domain-containing protein [Streptomyces resistomycificus]KUN99447.1 hypothetical protein AQJ84_10890 [Streptomyces resistomycificus]
MDQSKGHLCPECGAPRGTDNTPSCACTRRAADALRATRTAEAAAAEDFDPLRIRPYVELEGATEGEEDGGPTPVGGAEGSGAGRTAGGTDRADHHPAPPVEATMLLRPVDPAAPRPAGAPDTDATVTLPAVDATTAFPAVGAGPQPPSADATAALPRTDADATTVLHRTDPTAAAPSAAGTPVPPGPPAVDATSVLPTPFAPPATTPSPTDLHLFEAAGGPGAVASGPFGDDEGPSRRRRRSVLLGVAGAVVSVVAVAGIASGVFSYESPSREGAPQDVRAAVPDTSTSAASVAPSTPASSAPPTSASPSPTADDSPSPSPSPSASASNASPSPSRSAEATQAPTSTGAAGSAADAGEASEDDRRVGPVLRRGDQGPEVTELQQRLHELYLYAEAIDGDFSGKVEDALRNYQWSRNVGTDNLGVYDETTRTKLESETTEP